MDFNQDLIMLLPEIYQYFLSFCIINNPKLVLPLTRINKTMYDLSMKLFDIFFILNYENTSKYIFYYIKNDFLFAIKRLSVQCFELCHVTDQYSMKNEKFFLYFISCKSKILKKIEQDYENIDDLDHELLKKAIENCCPNIVKYILKYRTKMNYNEIYGFFRKYYCYNRIDILDCFLSTNVVVYDIISQHFNDSLNNGNIKMVKYFLRTGVITKKTINSAFRNIILIWNQCYNIKFLIPYVTKNYIQICLNELFSKYEEICNYHYIIKIILKFHPCMKIKLIKIMERNNIYFKYETIFE